MAKGSGTTKYQGSSASSAANKAQGGGKYEYVKKHPFYSEEYVEKLKALKPSWVMKEDGDTVNVTNNKGSEKVEVNRIGIGTGGADVIEYLGKEMDKGNKISYQLYDEKGTIEKSSSGFTLKTNKRTVKAKSLEALYLYTERGMGHPEYNGKLGIDYYKH